MNYMCNILIFSGSFFVIFLVESNSEKFYEVDSEIIKNCNCHCGERNEVPRILGGKESAINEFPWMARLTYFKTFYCGGVLVNNKYVLTAAHCVMGLMWFIMKVTLGEHDRCATSEPPITRHVVQVLMQDFKYYSTLENDIALLRLTDKVLITDTIKPICLPNTDVKDYADAKAIAAGWGFVTDSRNYTCHLNYVELSVMSNEDCQKTKYKPNTIYDRMLCAGAGYPYVGGRDTCQGDSGGPLTVERDDKRYELVGIVSWGIGCGHPGYPGVYTRVNKYLYWIRHNARAGCFCDN